jgi:2-hydroxychromene-2-carboxylate isomerase
MARKFQDQGGAAKIDPPALLRWASSRIVRRMLSPASIEKNRARAEKARRTRGAPHRVEYFHQIDDAYSHLAAQLLRPLLANYDVELVCHLVTVARDRNLPEPDLLPPLARYDSAKVAPHYGLRFPEGAGPPDAALVALAARILSAVGPADFPEAAVEVGDALWAGEHTAMDALANRFGLVDQTVADAHIESGTARREELGHYSGAMFHYGREWYWGADRFHHLERRLTGYGVRRGDDTGPICPRPAIESGPLEDEGSLTLEIFPSLRSPYTSIIFDAAVRLAADTGVKTVMRPVLPMVMRGVSLTRQKGMYIFRDTLREAQAFGLEWGNFYDPIGNPVRNCYSLYPWACSKGRGNELLSSFLHSAFFDGENTNGDRGMRIVVENAGLSWDEAEPIMGNRDWEDELEANRLAMYDFGSWGVPSFRLLDAGGNQALGVWGQDRLWLISREIQRLLREARA